MDLNEVKAEIEAICCGPSKMALRNDPLGHYVLLITGCLPGDPDYEVVFNPFEAEDEKIGRTGAYIWVFEIIGDEIFQYESKHNWDQSKRVLLDQDQSALKKLVWIIQNLHPRPSRASLSTG